MRTKKPMSAYNRLLVQLGITSIMVLTMSFNALAADTTQTLIAEGNQLVESFNNAEAVTRYEAAHLADPHNFEAHFKLARALVDTGEDLASDASGDYYERAVVLATELVEKDPDSPVAYYYLALASGKLAHHRGGKEKVKLSRAIEENARKARDIDPGWYRPYLLLGVYYREVANLNWFLKVFAKSFLGGLPEGTNQDSIDNLKLSLERKPNVVRSLYELARTYSIVGENEKAIESLDGALALPVTDHLDERYKEKSRALREKLARP